MQTKILNYRIIVDPDTRTGTNEFCYTASCPTLGIADSGDTVEEALANIKGAIETWVAFLVDDGKPVPVDQVENSLVAFTAVKAPPNIRVATA